MNQNSNLRQEAEQLIAEVNKTHRYSMSRIYSLWNQIEGKNETPQSCASCLIRKMRDIKKWYEEQKVEMQPIDAKTEVKPKTRKRKTETKYNGSKKETL